MSRDDKKAGYRRHIEELGRRFPNRSIDVIISDSDGTSWSSSEGETPEQIMQRFKDAARGRRDRETKRKAGGHNKETKRNVRLFKEYEQALAAARARGSMISKTEMKIKIGARHKLKPKAAISAIDRGKKAAGAETVIITTVNKAYS